MNLGNMTAIGRLSCGPWVEVPVACFDTLTTKCIIVIIFV